MGSTNEGLYNTAWFPEQYRDHLSNIKLMRSKRTAPVDTMGCEMLADKSEKPKIFRLQVLISLMLSSQTKDQVTASAMNRLIEFGCNIDSLISLDTLKLQELIYPVGFYKQKADYIKRTCLILKETFDGDIPSTIEGLCSLPGVGPKMAHLAMRVAWNKVTGIAVDTHVHRISNRLGWNREITKTPENTRISLESWLPREEWSSINWLLVGFGQEICLPVNPKCQECLNKDVCPVGRKNLKRSTRSKAIHGPFE